MPRSPRTSKRDRLERQLSLLEESRANRTQVSDQLLLAEGLSSELVAERITLRLANTTVDTSSRSLLSILRSNVFTLFNAVVGGCFLLLLVLGHWKDALFGFAVIANMLIGIIQEYTSKRTLDKIAIVNQARATVLRNGSECDVPVSSIVLDDALILRAGDQVPADAIVLSAVELEADESLLTGEVDPISKLPHDALLSGSSIVAGSAVARADRVGIESYSNIVTREARRFSLVRSELRNALSRVVRWISWALIPLVVIALNGQMQAVGGWTVAFANGLWRDAAISAIASIISMIPQGLVLITSISFALAAVGLARKRVLVQELPAVEGLARVDVVCFDKTGTLTEGEISFSDLHLTDSVQYEPGVSTVLGLFATTPDANATARALQSTFGDATTGIAPTATIAFNSTRKWSAIQWDSRWWILGAPEMVLENRSIDNKSTETIERAARAGMRVLVLAATESSLDLHEPVLDDSVVLHAVITLSENVRHDAPETIRFFMEQGISLKVISGDNAQTVGAIAARAGIPGADKPFDARSLPSTEPELSHVLEAHSVFGRVTPEQKKAIVLTLQARGHVVAMTGDGVNDALALKVADLGVSMGNGSAATKAVARLVLLDNQFGRLPQVVAEGRRVIANVERVSRLFLTKTTWAMLLAVIFGLLLWPFPFLPRQLSGIDGYTIGIASFLLALLPNTRRYMPGFLRRSLRFCIPSGLVIGTAVVGLTAVLRFQTVGVGQMQTSVSLLLSLTGLWILITLSRPFSPTKFAIVAAMYALFALMFCVPLARDFFGLTLLSWSELSIVAAFAIVSMSLLELVNALVTRRMRRDQLVSGG